MNETTTNSAFVQNYLADARNELTAALVKIQHCLKQLNDDQVWWRPSASMNSMGNLLLHLCGNLRWKFRAVISGLPDDRDRPREFSERGPIPKAELLRRLEEAVGAADGVLAGLMPSQLLERRGYRMLSGATEDAVQGVILQTLTHLSGHTQEIIILTRLQLGEAYQFFMPSTPPPDAKTIAADDLVFASGMLPAHAPAAPTDREQPVAASNDSPIKDYLLDLEQEFQDQNEQGKVEP